MNVIDQLPDDALLRKILRLLGGVTKPAQEVLNVTKDAEWRHVGFQRFAHPPCEDKQVTQMIAGDVTWREGPTANDLAGALQVARVHVNKRKRAM